MDSRRVLRGGADDVHRGHRRLRPRGGRARNAVRVSLGKPAVRSDRPALVLQALLDQELKRRPGAATGVKHAVDLPLGEEVVVALTGGGPVREPRKTLELARERDALLDRAL